MGGPTPFAEKTDSDSVVAKSIRLVVGLIVFLASFVVLWQNEGRVDIPALTRQSKPVAAGTIDSTSETELVSVTGKVKSTQLLGDPRFLEFGPFITLSRKVEMYVWVERLSVEEQKRRVGPKEREPIYSYEKKWSDSPPDSDLFAEAEGHRNPAMQLQSVSYAVDEATIGAYRFSPKSADMPTGSPVSLTRKNYIRTLGASLRGEYIFLGKGKIEAPRVGDVRVSYSAVKSGALATLVGKLTGDAVTPYLYANDKRIYRLFLGSREAAFSQLPTSNKATAWILRLAGLLMMWGGLCLFFGPLQARFALFPAFETMGQPKAVATLFAAATAFTALTLLVSMLARSMFLLGITLVMVCIVLWFFAGRRFSLASLASMKPSRMRTSTPPPPSRPPSPAPSGPSGEKQSTLALQDDQIRQTDPSDSEESKRPPDARPKQRSPEGVRIVCENCGLGYTVPALYQGRKVQCHRCGHKFYVPLGFPDDDSSPTIMDTSS